MSTRVAALDPSRGRSIWPVAVVISIVMLTAAVIAVSLDRGEPAPATTTSKVEAPAVASAVGVASGIAGAAGTAANTPSELRSLATAKRIGAGISFVRHVPRRGTDADASAPAEKSLGVNTPTEISGGMPSQDEIWAREHVRRG
jgi:hypothetical protein